MEVSKYVFLLNLQIQYIESNKSLIQCRNLMQSYFVRIHYGVCHICIQIEKRISILNCRSFKFHVIDYFVRNSHIRAVKKSQIK